MRDLSNKDIIHIKRKNIEYIQFRRLLEYPNLIHAFTLKKYGIDFGSNANFEKEKTKYINNYKILAENLGINYQKIFRPLQTHTDVIKNVEEKDLTENFEFKEEFKNVDGVITKQKGLYLSLLYADCTPIIFYDPVKNIVANTHSGWKGTLQKIGQKTVKKMKEEYGCNSKDIICCIGPCIRKCHFQVENDVKDLFYKEFEYTKRINEIIQKDIIIDGKQKYKIDTTLINKIILEEEGILKENIIDSGICTVCNGDLIHSFRVDKEKSGRNTMIIGIKE